MGSFRTPAKSVYCSLGRLGQTCKYNQFNDLLQQGVCSHPDDLRCCNSTNLPCLLRDKGKCKNTLGACSLGEPAETLRKEKLPPVPRYKKYYDEKEQ